MGTGYLRGREVVILKWKESGYWVLKRKGSGYIEVEGKWVLRKGSGYIKVEGKWVLKKEGKWLN